MKKVGWPKLYIFLLKLYRQWNFEKIQVVFFLAQFFLQKIIVFSMESIQNQVFLNFLVRFFWYFESCNRLLSKTWNFSETICAKNDLN